MGMWLAITLAAAGAAVEAEGDTESPFIIHEPCEEYRQGEEFVIRARLVDQSAVFEPKVLYRSGAPDWSSAPLEREGDSDHYRAVIPASELQGKLEYFIEVFDEYGNGPARYGSAKAPIRISPARKPRKCQQIVEMRPLDRRESKPVGVAAPAPSSARAGSTAAAKPAAVVKPAAAGTSAKPVAGQGSSSGETARPTEGAPSKGAVTAAAAPTSDKKTAIRLRSWSELFARVGPPPLASKVLGAAGAASLVTGTFFAVRARAQYNDSIDPAHVGGQRDARDGRKSQRAANIGFGLGTAALLAGAVVWNVARPGSKPAVVAVNPQVGTDGMGLVLSGDW